MKTEKAEARTEAKLTEAKPAEARSEARRASRRTREVTLEGLPIAPGVAIGPVYDTSEPPAEAPRRTIQPAELEEEKARLTTAAATSRKQVSKLKKRLSVLPEEAQEELEPLLDAYAMMLGESRLLRGARKRIETELLAAETAVQDEAEAIAALILAAKDDDRAGLKRRAEEVREIAKRLTRNLTATPFRSLKEVPEGAILVHTARGGIVDEAALLAALESRQLAWAGVDVFAQEPLDTASPLRGHPRVLPTPHLAANTPRGAVGMSTMAADCIVAVLAGRVPAMPGAVVVRGRLPAAA